MCPVAPIPPRTLLGAVEVQGLDSGSRDTQGGQELDPNVLGGGRQGQRGEAESGGSWGGAHVSLKSVGI